MPVNGRITQIIEPYIRSCADSLDGRITFFVDVCGKQITLTREEARRVLFHVATLEDAVVMQENTELP